MVIGGARAVALAAIGVFALVTGSESALAERTGSPLAPVWHKLDDVHYTEAAKLLTEVLDRGGLAVGDLADAHRLGGEIFAALGDRARSCDHFVRWLLLDPGGHLPVGTSPKIASPFIEARKRVDAHGPLRVRPRTTRSAGTVTVELVAEVDPLDMVAGMRVVYGDGADGPLTDVVDARGQLTASIEFADRDWLRVSISALDDNGNELIVLGADEPIELPPLIGWVRLSEPPALSRRRPWYAQWYTWAGVAGVTAGAGVYFGHRARSDRDEWAALNADSAAHSYDEARALEHRARRNATLANIGYGAAGLAVVTAIVCGLRDSREDSATVVAPMIGESGAAGMTYSVTF